MVTMILVEAYISIGCFPIDTSSASELIFAKSDTGWVFIEYMKNNLINVDASRMKMM